MKKQLSLGLAVIAVMVSAAITALPVGTAMEANAQTTTGDTGQIKDYLNQAMQALDSGNNTLALQQIDLASDTLENMTGVTDDVEEEDENEIAEEGAGEDADEPGDVDTNDEEEAQSQK
jgi:hypothetical protein